MKGKLGIAGFLLLMIIAPLLIKSEYLLNLLILICLYAILSHSWNISGWLLRSDQSWSRHIFRGRGAYVPLSLAGRCLLLPCSSGRGSVLPDSGLCHRVPLLQDERTLFFHRHSRPCHDRAHHGAEPAPRRKLHYRSVSEGIQSPDHLLSCIWSRGRYRAVSSTRFPVQSWGLPWSLCVKTRKRLRP